MDQKIGYDIIFFIKKIVLFNIKQKKDFIKLKKNLKKKTEVENLEGMGYQANFEKAYKPLIEPLNKFVEETQETNGLGSN